MGDEPVIALVLFLLYPLLGSTSGPQKNCRQRGKVPNGSDCFLLRESHLARRVDLVDQTPAVGFWINRQRCLCQNQPDAAHFPHVVDSMADPEASIRYLVYQFHPTSQMEHSQMEAIRPNWNLIIPSCPTFVANI
ncbi:hypothetical protein P7K49_026393 [Saguinus oedipus]|uniref:Secreted protein n=1 Tax=Saguinus oedipus TaxID=9490 RepID=A0ABQ9UD33_SAGOE|nr:hypothetical protein P7K49_026393 [Saguinus oedipus]